MNGISTGFHLEATVTPATAKAGEPFTLSVRVTNIAGSVIQEVNSFVTVTVQNATTRQLGKGTLLTSEFQLLQGQRAISETYSFPEPIQMVVRDDAGNEPGVTGTITITPGSPVAVHLSSDPPWVGGSFGEVVGNRCGLLVEVGGVVAFHGVGDASVVVAVSGAHRAEAFEACREGIEQLKHDVPIWKKELLATGEGHWVMGA